ncbi:ABC transporter ATP-binding protein [Chitinophaga nivalis]|uniref:ABC transporter ATP-binding protein n=1 Tax=Chitinophaga nivalis TaxID=2991709 RepID=A0ABT3II16_9BACT|nr:ABC transporter ATP-binding protein [Chitinophaga nivalis]MCW3466701.1 ABC transporter ATP-binding protein [Chitinophaga nivalis]MCW3483608.1 ABC transporter ATP-binding protein [Chitinophaga nivalis]
MLQAIALTRQFGRHTALNALHLEVGKGEVFCLLGPNGAGKTTTINCFLGFLAPSSGRVLVNGIDVQAHREEARRHIAYIPETVMLYPYLTGYENLEFFHALTGQAYTKSQLFHFLLDAGLQEAAIHRRVETYSKGMRQKVGIAIATAKNAKALLLDEPTSGLDPRASNEFSVLLQRFSSEGRAVLMATHDLYRAREVAGRIGIMKNGHLLTVMQAQEVDHYALEAIYMEHMNAAL